MADKLQDMEHRYIKVLSRLFGSLTERPHLSIELDQYIL